MAYLGSFNTREICVIKVHHLLADGYAVQELFRQLFDSYENDRERPTYVKNDTEVISVLDAEHSWLHSSEAQGRLEWWACTLRTQRVLELQSQGRQLGVLESTERLLGSKDLERLAAICRRRRFNRGEALFGFFAAAVQAFARSLGGSICYQKLNRGKQNLRMIGDFSDHVLVPFDDSACAVSLDCAVQRLREADERWLPYWHIVESLCPERMTWAAPLSRCQFNLYSVRMEQLASMSKTFAPLSHRPLTTRNLPFDVILNCICVQSMSPQGRHITLSLRYNTALMSRDTADLLIDEVISRMRSA